MEEKAAMQDDLIGEKNGLSGQSDGVETVFAVTEGKLVLILGLGFLFVGAAVTVCEFLFSTRALPLWAFALIGYILLFGLGLCMEGHFRRLEVEGTKICYVNWHGGRKCFNLDQIGKVEAADSPGKSQDYLILTDRENNKLCKLEFGMNNAVRLLLYLRDHGIPVDRGRDTGDILTRILQEEKIPDGELERLANQAYQRAEQMISAWQKKKGSLGAELELGLVEYHAGRLSPEDEGKRAEAVIEKREDKELPEDYLCALEVYVKKDGEFVWDKKGNLLGFIFPIIRMTEPLSQGEQGQLRYDGGYAEEIQTMLKELERYLPGHKFSQGEFELGYRLKRQL